MRQLLVGRGRVISILLVGVSPLTTAAAQDTSVGTPAEPGHSGSVANEAAATPASSPSSADPTGSQDIVVTATRRTETLSHVPLSVVATTQATLDKQGVRNIEDLTRLTPSVTFTPDAHLPGLTNVTIRGIQSTSGVPTTGIYIDDTPVQVRRGTSPVRSNPYPQIFDLDRVEVLRGPQGTLFGTGSVGGAIRFITPEPSLHDLSYYGRAEVSTTENGAPSYEAGIAVGAPIIDDQLGFRASIWHRHDGGYIDRLSRVTDQVEDKNINFGNSYTGRLAIAWQPTPNLKITPSLFFQNTYQADPDIYTVDVSQPSKKEFREDQTKIRQFYKDRFYLPALKASLELGKVTLFSNSSYLIRKTSSRSDDVVTDLATFGGYVGPLPSGFDDDPAHTLASAREHLFTQEFRIQNNDSSARFNWIVGAFFSRSRIREVDNGLDPQLLQELNYLGSVDPTFPTFNSVADVFGVDLYNGVSGFVSLPHLTETEKSVFAQVDYNVTEKLKVTAGVRYTDNNLRLNEFDAGPYNGTDGKTSYLKSTIHPISPKFGISYQATSRDLFYFNAAKGVRSGDFVGPVGLTCADDATALGFDPLATRATKQDSVWSYEVGNKSRLFGGRLTVDASAYRIDWKNVQSLIRLTSCGIYTTLNYGDARSEGFDLALGANPFRGLQLGASVSYTDARYTSNIPGANGSIIRRKGEPFAVAPWSIYVNGEYEWAIGGGNRAYARADYAYTSHNHKPLDLASPLTDPDIPRPPATSTISLRAGVRLAKRLDLSVFVNNLLNDHPQLSIFHDLPGTGAFRAITLRPRTIGLTATVRE